MGLIMHKANSSTHYSDF